MFLSILFLKKKEFYLGYHKNWTIISRAYIRVYEIYILRGYSINTK